MRSGPTSLRVIPHKKVPEGSDVTLWCVFLTVDKDTTYSWYRGQEEKINSSLYRKVLKATEDNGFEQIEHILTLRNVSREDQGWYSCRAENKIKPSAPLKTYLTVTGKGR